MSLADPQTITVATVAQTLPRISPGESKSVYEKADGEYVFTVSRALGVGPGRSRNNFRMRLDRTKVTADPFVPTTNVKVSTSATFVVDVPIAGFTEVEVKDMCLGLAAWVGSASFLAALQKQT